MIPDDLDLIVENRPPTKGKPHTWEGPIPPVIERVADLLLAFPHKRVTVPCEDTDMGEDVRLAVAARFEREDWRPHCRDVTDSHGYLTGVSITVSFRKG